jgi:hypothetical protein
MTLLLKKMCEYLRFFLNSNKIRVAIKTGNVKSITKKMKMFALEDIE